MSEPQGVTAEDLKRLKGQDVFASVSGGKDSTALCLWLRENEIPHRRVFADTGWEHPSTYEYIRGDLTDAIGPISEVGREGGMPGLILEKGMFPGRLSRFCTSELKVKPILEFLRSNSESPVNCLGIRAQESKSRAKLGRWEFNESMDCDVWRPLIRWSESDIIAIHKRHGIRPNPLYLEGKGVSRVGCWPCIFSRKSEIAQCAESTPWRVDQIRELERSVCETVRGRTERDGKERLRPSFFHAQDSNGKIEGIDAVALWSRTSHGGRQLRLIDPSPAGCEKWGMCDAAGSAVERAAGK